MVILLGIVLMVIFLGIILTVLVIAPCFYRFWIMWNSKPSLPAKKSNAAPPISLRPNPGG